MSERDTFGTVDTRLLCGKRGFAQGLLVHLDAFLSYAMGVSGAGETVAMRVFWTIFLCFGTALARAEPVALPPGLTQAGLSADENATAGNNATHIARDSAGHVHMVWVDSGRQGEKTGPVYRRLNVAADGAVQLETPPVYIADKTPGDWNAYPALAATGDTVFVVWQGGGTARVRRFDGREWGPVVDTGAKSDGRDVGPSMQADASGVRVVTPSGQFAISTDGGATWKTEPVPLPSGQHMKTASIAADPAGGVVLAFSSVVRDPKETAKNEGSGGYWQLRTIRRSSGGAWSDAGDVLAAFPEWAEAKGASDSLADWVRIGTDTAGGQHLLWHGTGISHIYGNDQAYYAYRAPKGEWQAPIPLVKRDDAKGIKFSFAPSLTLDGENVLATVFYDVYDGTRWAGFDADLVPFLRGTQHGAMLPLTHFVRASIDAKKPVGALSSRFPSAALAPYHAPDGHVWLDMLETFIPMGVDGVPKSIVHQRVDVTGAVKP